MRFRPNRPYVIITSLKSLVVMLIYLKAVTFTLMDTIYYIMPLYWIIACAFWTISPIVASTHIYLRDLITLGDSVPLQFKHNCSPRKATRVLKTSTVYTYSSLFAPYRFFVSVKYQPWIWNIPLKGQDSCLLDSIRTGRLLSLLDLSPCPNSTLCIIILHWLSISFHAE